MGIAIKVENLSKAYQLGEIGTGTLSNDLKRWAYRMRGKEDPFLKIGETNDRTKKGESDIVWSLKDLNFEIEQGDAVGIIGRNGAGKSTLLKILSRVTSPTTGSVKVKGRVASLLEVGTGFHPELSGRDNIFLNGAILGMRKAEIKKHFDAIVDFAGIERYIDTPVKRYSSGMYVRLAFAVAAHLESEILVVDEVLAVGDAEFQKKCLGKMNEVSKGEGRTVLFVSHNMDSISRICAKAIYLKNGLIDSYGESEKIITGYIRLNSTLIAKRAWENDSDAPGDNFFRLKSIEVEEVGKGVTDNINIKSEISINVGYYVLAPNLRYTHGINIYSENDTHVLSSHDKDSKTIFDKSSPGLYFTKVFLPNNFLSEGTYKLSFAIMSYNPFFVHFHHMDSLRFNIYDELLGDTARGSYSGPYPGVVRPILKWQNEIKNENKD